MFHVRICHGRLHNMHQNCDTDVTFAGSLPSTTHQCVSGSNFHDALTQPTHSDPATHSPSFPGIQQRIADKAKCLVRSNDQDFIRLNSFSARGCLFMWYGCLFHRNSPVSRQKCYIAACLRCELIEVRDSPHGIFGPWARWNRAPPDVQSSWETAVAVAAAAVSWKLRSTFRPGNYNKTFS